MPNGNIRVASLRSNNVASLRSNNVERNKKKSANNRAV